MKPYPVGLAEPVLDPRANWTSDAPLIPYFATVAASFGVRVKDRVWVKFRVGFGVKLLG